jgi:hypothetical protein
MKRFTKVNLKNNGSAIVLAMFAVLILFIMGVALLRIGLTSRIFSIRNTEQIRARDAADAGLAKALYEMNKKLLSKPWDDSSLPSASDVQLEDSDNFYTFDVTKDASSNYFMESTGSAGQARRTVRTSLRLAGPFDYALFTNDAITVFNSAAVSQYNNGPEDGSLKVGTNSIQGDKVQLKSSAVINGDVLVGPGGDPAVVIDNKGTITGDTSTLAERNELTNVTVPAAVSGLGYYSPQKVKDDLSLPTGSYKLETIDLGTKKTLTITGQVTIYVTSSVTLGNKAEIKVNPSCSLIMYVTGNLEGKDDSSFNNTTCIPKNMQIYGLSSCTSMAFKNSTALYGTIYAPNANVTYYNKSGAYGSVVAKSFEQKNSAAFYYDANLKDVTVNDILMKFVYNRWSED